MNQPLRHPATNATPPISLLQEMSEAFAFSGNEAARYYALLGPLQKQAPLLLQAPCPAAAAIFRLAHAEADLLDIQQLAASITQHFDTLVIMGTGGSGLSGQALCSFRYPYANAMQGKVKLVFLDNIDPAGLQLAMQQFDWPRTAFLIISKSGATVETLAQTGAMATELHQRGLNPGAQLFVITCEGDSPLMQIARYYGMRVLPHDPELSGRFSIFSAVGLLPACVAGLDIHAFRRGMRQSLTDHLTNGGEAAKGASFHAAMMERGRSVTVLLSYSDRLFGVSSWFRQSWAESIAKGGKGSTPVRARGATDQHSQLQLYLDGPKDKYFTLLYDDMHGQGPRIDLPHFAQGALKGLHGHTIGDIMQREQQATTKLLLAHGCPLRRLIMQRMDEESLGGLLMQLTLEMMFTAHLLGVNAFDQPAVEQSKARARQESQNL